MPECRDDADILRRHVATVSLSRAKARRPSSSLTHYPSQIFEQGVSNKALSGRADTQRLLQSPELFLFRGCKSVRGTDARGTDGDAEKGRPPSAARSLLVGTEGIATAEDDGGGYSGTTSGRSVFKAERPRGKREG